MSSMQKPIEDAIIALTRKHADVYGEPFFHSDSCELAHMQAEDLAEELSTLGYSVSVVDDYTVSWEPLPEAIHRSWCVRRPTKIWQGTSVAPRSSSASPRHRTPGATPLAFL